MGFKARSSNNNKARGGSEVAFVVEDCLFVQLFGPYIFRPARRQIGGSSGSLEGYKHHIMPTEGRRSD